MINQNSYQASKNYESFICLARLCEREEYGAHNSYMQNVIDLENEEINVKHLTLEKEFDFVKKMMVEAGKYASNRVELPLYNKDKQWIQKMLFEIAAATTSTELLNLCKQGIEILRIYKRK